MPAEGVGIRPSGQKVFIPLENNPEVFTSLVQDLGLSSDLGFHDVYSLDEPELLALIPRPVYALIFITPPAMYDAVRRADGTRSLKEGLSYDKSGDDETVMWFPQTIGNACGLMALIHSVASGEPRASVKKDSLLDRLFQQAKSMKPMQRAELLYTSEELEEAHMRAARTGHSAAPRAEEFCPLHFIAFIRGKDGHQWELEGASDGPIDRGALGEGEDLLSETALENGVKRFLKAANGDLNFSIVALAKKGE
jgi:ubiquitin carboxyl-terminal hydrolase L3